MRAVRYHEFGEPDVLKYETGIPRPEPGPGEVLVNLHAAAVNPIDTYIRSGAVTPSEGLPHIGGADGAGVVVDIGSDVDGFIEGDRVFMTGRGLFSSGTYAEYIVVPEAHLAHLAESVEFTDAAGAAMAFATAWRGLVSLGNVQLGDVVLVHGATGGVGHAGLQIAKESGAFVVGTCRDGEPAHIAKQYGADVTVDYRVDDLASAIHDVIPERGFNVILDTHADQHLSANLDNLSRGGRIIVLGEEGPISLDPGYSMTAKIADAQVNFMSIMASPDDQAPILERVNERLADDKFSVEIDSIYDLEETADAHRKVMASGTIGKIVIEI